MIEYLHRSSQTKPNPASSLPVMESFYTIQGEGYYQGSPAVFIRLGGCDVGCHWCDVKESWDAGMYPEVAIKAIVDKVLKYPSRMAVITGGEPAMYNLVSLTSELHKNDFRTHIETSGAYPLTGKWDWVCLSPKKRKTPVHSVYGTADELKIIIYNRSDFRWAEEQRERVKNHCRLYLQPEWSKMKVMMDEIVVYIKKNPAWKISLQIHKFMNIP